MILGIAFFVLLLLGVPVAFVLLGSAIIFAFESGRIAVLGAFPSQLFTSLEIFDLLAIPLFILLGEIMSKGGLTRQLFESASRTLSRVPRSLAFVTLTCNIVVSAILGSANAQVAVMSRVTLPEMEKQGYRRTFAAALNAGAAPLGAIIPPSMIFIIYAVLARVSIGEMFLAGVIPGILLAIFIGLIIAFSDVWESGAPKEEFTTAAGAAGLRGTVALLGALSVPILIVVSIVGGIVTPTESAGLAVILAVLITWTLFTPIPLPECYNMLVRTAMNSAIILILIAAARVFGFILTYYRVPQAVSDILVGLSGGPISFLLLVVLLLLLVGALMEGMAVVIILVPILLPIAVNIYGIDPVVFGIVFTLTLVIGLITPPVGTVLYIAAAMSNVRIGRLSWALLPFVAASMLVVLLVIFFPWLAIGLR